MHRLQNKTTRLRTDLLYLNYYTIHFTFLTQVPLAFLSRRRLPFAPTTPTSMSGWVMISGWIWTPRHVEKLGPCSHLHHDHHVGHRHPRRNRGLTSPLGRTGLNRQIKFHEIDLQIRFGTKSRILWFGHLQNLGESGWGKGPGRRTMIRRRARPFGVEISACSCRLAIRTRSSRRGPRDSCAYTRMT